MTGKSTLWDINLFSYLSLIFPFLVSDLYNQYVLLVTYLSTEKIYTGIVVAFRIVNAYSYYPTLV